MMSPGGGWLIFVDAARFCPTCRGGTTGVKSLDPA
jgi:hypothetical protein